MAHTRTVVRVTVQLIALALIGIAFFMRIPQVSGPSMEPRVRSGEIVVINTLAYRFGPIRRGDVIALHHETPTPETYLKRVVALPGERIAIDAGVVEINGAPLEEPYVSFRDKRSIAARTVPANAVFVLGDNRAESEDSRDWGPIDEHDVIGKSLAGLWPPKAFR